MSSAPCQSFTLRQSAIVTVILLSSFASFAFVVSRFTSSMSSPLSLVRHIIQRTNNDDEIAKRLAALVQKRATASDPELIQLIRDVMDPPSKHMIKMSRWLMDTPQSREVDRILKNKNGGFYVECGAFDGETTSNTIYLEVQRKWTGLLVEMDPYFYTQLLGKSRNSWSIKACLSPKPYVTQLAYKESAGPHGTLESSEPINRNRSQSTLVACYPLYALLVALNRTTVDYFSLDVEGGDFDILQTIPFKQLNITTLSVESSRKQSIDVSLLKFMTEQGYVVHNRIVSRRLAQHVDDYIFVRRQANDTR